MKRKLAILLASLMLVSSFTACSSDDTDVDTSSDDDTSVSTDSEEEEEEVVEEEVTYVYGYASLSFAEYWASELDGDVDEYSVVSTDLDSEGYTDTGMYDAVSRATVKHGIYRSQLNFTVEVTGEKILSEEVEEFEGEEQTVITTDPDDTLTVIASGQYIGIDDEEEMMFEADGDGICFEDGASTFEVDGESYSIVSYQVTGYKSIPVAIPSDLVDSVESFVESSDVTADTYGLKTMDTDGNYGARDTSGTTGNEVYVADYDNITYVYDTSYGSDAEVYFYIMNEDGTEMTFEQFAAYAASFEAATYEYYGDDDTYTYLVGTYGAKIAADTWWSDHHGIRIDLGINFDFDRYEGSGYGYYVITMISADYDDITAYIQFLEPYPTDVTATLSGSTLTIEGVDDADLEGQTITITYGSKPSTTVVDGETMDSSVFEITGEMSEESETEYTITITQENYQPITITVIGE